MASVFAFRCNNIKINEDISNCTGKSFNSVHCYYTFVHLYIAIYINSSCPPSILLYIALVSDEGQVYNIIWCEKE